MARMLSTLLTLLTAVSLAACSGDDSTGPSNGGDSGGTAAVEIRMQNVAFVGPSGGDAVTVTVGTPVEWVNLDNVQHTATSTSVPAGGAAFDSGLLGNGDRFRFTPQVEGTWVYFCEVHPGTMVDAKITATASGTSNDPGGNDPPSGPGY